MAGDGCVFCAITRGEIQADLVVDEPAFIAILDNRPLFRGHTLLMPREHVEALPDLPADQVGPLFQWAQRLAVAIRDAMAAEGTFVAINNTVSQSVPHLHIHIVPRTKGDGLRGFFWPRTKYDHDDHMAETAAEIRSALAAG